MSTHIKWNIIMQPWKTLDRKLVFEMNKFLKVEQHTVQLSDGTVISDWPWIISPDFILIFPLTERGTVLFFHQTKYAIDGTSYAPIGGYIEKGEYPLAAAKRELLEEMGCEATEWLPLGNYPINGNHGGGRGHFFLAKNVKKVKEPIVDDLEEMELTELTLDEIEQKLFGGEIKVEGWAAITAIALLHLKKENV